MLVEFGKANYLEKARQQPDKVRMVLDKLKTDGLMPTIESVRSKLDQPIPMGYCNVGEVLEVGAGVIGFQVGDRVASNGNHAEVVCVPANLCAKVPEGVTDDTAAFTVISAIGLQGIRLAQPTLGEAFVVTGLGLIGLVTVQLLVAHGCRVLGLDFDPERLRLAQQFGAETVNLAAGADPVQAATVFSRGRGVDGVIITAATKSNEPMHQAALMCRKKGRIVLVGVVGLELSRADFYQKELSFQVSCSYGPGRYDPAYEQDGHDYPVGYVRWTEQRNFEAVLDMFSTGRLDVNQLVSHRFAFDEAAKAYELVTSDEPSLGILLEYASRTVKSDGQLLERTVGVAPVRPSAVPGVLGVIGAGNYASKILLPAFQKAGAVLRTVASSTGVSGLEASRKFGFAQNTTDTSSMFADPAIDTVVIATRHDTHARFVCQALRAKKHVFVEKPLALSVEQVNEIMAVHQEVANTGFSPILMVGFNRRFSPQVKKMKQLLDSVRQPKSFVYTVNAGAIPPEHWTQSQEVGGGRILGEACHFVDLLRYLAGQRVVSVQGMSMGEAGAAQRDTLTFTLAFADGSIGIVHYFANGARSFPKERLEVFAAGRVLQLDNFRHLTGFGWPGFTKMNLWRQDKGQDACAAAFLKAVQEGGEAPIPLVELEEVARVTLRVVEAVNA
jgi:predicted dehydrogenase/threonine dehydrogenase-like Zn-dependent dehydrogenase